MFVSQGRSGRKRRSDRPQMHGCSPILALVLACALAACGDSERGAPSSEDREVVFSPPGGQCSEQAGFFDYLDRIPERMQRHWALPGGIGPEDARVRLVFTLDEQGRLRSLEAPGSEPAALKESAIAAMRSAEPFGRLPDALTCIARLEPLAATFTLATPGEEE